MHNLAGLLLHPPKKKEIRRRGALLVLAQPKRNEYSAKRNRDSCSRFDLCLEPRGANG